MDPDSSEERAARSEAQKGRARPRLAVVVTDNRGRPRDGHGVAAWLARTAPQSARGEVSIALISDAQIRALNRMYRRRDRATDVLSFPADRSSPHADRDWPLGDVAIATGVARRQARAAGHSYATELKVLALHGLLHLLGYDHHDPADGGRMARVERALRRKGGLPAGLIERARTVGRGR